MESLRAGDLKIDIVEQDSAIRLHWLGMSNERQKARHGFRPRSRWFCYRASPRLLNHALTLAAAVADGVRVAQQAGGFVGGLAFADEVAFVQCVVHSVRPFVRFSASASGTSPGVK